MAGFVVDCSMTISWCLQDEHSTYADTVLNSFTGQTALVPQLWRYEVANVLLLAIKRKRISDADMHQGLAFLAALPIIVAEATTEISELLLLSQRYGLSAYEGAYLQLCLVHGLPIATHEKQLAAAVVAAGGSMYLAAA